MADLYLLVVQIIDLFGIELNSFSDADLMRLLEKNDLVKLAALFKIPVKNMCRDGVIDALIKSSRSPSILNYFTKPAAKSRLRTLYVELSKIFFT